MKTEPILDSQFMKSFFNKKKNLFVVLIIRYQRNGFVLKSNTTTLQVQSKKY